MWRAPAESTGLLSCSNIGFGLIIVSAEAEICATEIRPEKQLYPFRVEVRSATGAVAF